MRTGQEGDLTHEYLLAERARGRRGRVLRNTPMFIDAYDIIVTLKLRSRVDIVE